MTVRELYVKLRDHIDSCPNSADLKVKCGEKEVEWSWIIVNNGGFDHVELSLLKGKEEVENEGKSFADNF